MNKATLSYADVTICNLIQKPVTKNTNIHSTKPVCPKECAYVPVDDTFAVALRYKLKDAAHNSLNHGFVETRVLGQVGHQLAADTQLW